MTLAEQRTNFTGCWDLAIAELRRRMVADCRGAPIRYDEVLAAFARMVRR